MTEPSADDVEEIRKNRREELVEAADTLSTPEEPVYVNSQAELDATVNENDVVLVDFYADWCGPCQMLEPILENLAAETDAAVAKVDVDQNQQLASHYGVQGVPNVVAFSAGEPAEQVVGVRDEAFYANLVEEVAN
ncbi:thioredoxin [Haloparvum sp. PAK95]|jgi:thioredoxin 1|uniref:thioredoxin n=1 Tax=Haloparvum sp. PAK95 TaxID=3418962 RepID=UPI003D2E9F39